ncbi:MAG: hypothetical protein HQM03_16180 [Magnetococcales bacterium]|nr:hypothetical protein [Magnetococcales bacterium]
MGSPGLARRVCALLALLTGWWWGGAEPALALSVTGALQVHSALHEPFSADLPFVLEPGEEMPGVEVVAGVNSDFVGGGAGDGLRNRLTARLEEDNPPLPGAGGRTGRIVITGTQPENELFFTILLRIARPDLTFVRNYSVVLGAFPSGGVLPVFPVQSHLPGGARVVPGLPAAGGAGARMAWPLAGGALALGLAGWWILRRRCVASVPASAVGAPPRAVVEPVLDPGEAWPEDATSAEEPSASFTPTREPDSPRPATAEEEGSPGEAPDLDLRPRMDFAATMRQEEEVPDSWTFTPADGQESVPANPPEPDRSRLHPEEETMLSLEFEPYDLDENALVRSRSRT